MKSVAFDENEKLLYVFFDNDVDNAATVIGNYQFGDKFKTELATFGGEAEFFQGSKTVKIYLSEKERDAVKELKNASKFRLVVSNVKDLQENLIKERIYEGTVDVYGTVSEIQVTKAEATALDTVVVTFNQDITRVDENSFGTIQGKEIADAIN